MVRLVQDKPRHVVCAAGQHICSTIHNSGKFTVKRKTVGKRMVAKLHDIAARLRRRINDPIEQTGDWLKQVERGYFNYHAVRGTS
jgi:hypothetical protein